MTATAWFIIAIVCFSLAGIALIASVFMFIKMRIPAVIGDLTGRTVAREIKAMRDSNASSGDKRFRPSQVNLERGTLTDKVDVPNQDKNAMGVAHASKRLDKTSEELSKSKKKRNGTVGLSDAAVGTLPTDQLIQDSTSDPTNILSDNATEVLSDNATEVLSDNATEVLSDSMTEVLSEGTEVLNEGTTVLSSTEKLDDAGIPPVQFAVIKDITEIHTDEEIK